MQGPTAAADPLSNELARLSASVADAWALAAVDPRAAESAARDALRRAQEVGSELHEGRALTVLGHVLDRRGERRRARMALRSARELLAGSDSSWIARCLDGLTATSDTAAEALSVGAAALDAARAAPGVDVEFTVRLNLGMAYVELGDVGSAVEQFSGALSLADGLEDRRPLPILLAHLAQQYTDLGDLAAAEQLLELADAEARAVGGRYAELIVLVARSRCQRAAGRFGDAVQTAQAGVRAARAFEHADALTLALAELAEAGRAAGLLWLAVDAASEAIRLDHGRLDHGRLDHGRHDARRLAALATRAQAYLEAGDPHHARLDADAVVAAADHAPQLAAAAAHEVLATVAERSGQLQSALVHLRAYQRTMQAAFDDEARKRTLAARSRLEVHRARHEADHERRQRKQLSAALGAAETAQARTSEALARMEALADQDALTGVANRRFLDRQLEALDRAVGSGGARSGELDAVALAMVDIDHFKAVNDTFGHQVGDEVLAEVARLLALHVRTGDLVARYGGEEFAVILPGADLAEAAAVCERLRAAVEAHPWREARDGLSVTVSVGLASAHDGDDVAALLARADRALYTAKRRGRNRLIV